jgi:hypothetical protein
VRQRIGRFPNNGRVITVAFSSHECVKVPLEVSAVRELDWNLLPLALEDRTFQCVSPEELRALEETLKKAGKRAAALMERRG